MKISERGQITVPKKFRDRFGLRPETEIELVEMNHQLVLRKKSRHLPLDALRGILRKQGSAKTTDEILESTRGR